MNLPIVVALAIAFDGARTKARLDLVLAGVAIALACLLKQPAGIAAIPIGLYLLRRDHGRQRNLGVAHSIGHAVLFSAGFFATLAIAALSSGEGILGGGTDGARSQAAVRCRRDDVCLERAWAVGVLRGVTLPLLLGAAWSSARMAASGLLAGAQRGVRGALDAARRVGPSRSRHGTVPRITTICSFCRRWRSRRPVLRHASRRPASGSSSCRGRRPPALARDDGARLPGRGRDRARGAQPAAEAAVYVRDHSAPEDRIFVWGQGDRQTDVSRRRSAGGVALHRHLSAHRPRLRDARHAGRSAARSNPEAWANLHAISAAHPPRFIIDTDWTPATRSIPSPGIRS